MDGTYLLLSSRWSGNPVPTQWFHFHAVDSDESTIQWYDTSFWVQPVIEETTSSRCKGLHNTKKVVELIDAQFMWLCSNLNNQHPSQSARLSVAALRLILVKRCSDSYSTVLHQYPEDQFQNEVRDHSTRVLNCLYASSSLHQSVIKLTEKDLARNYKGDGRSHAFYAFALF